MNNQTSRSFEATESGGYQVEVVSNGCVSELSDVFTFEVTSLESALEEAYGFKIHPNPTDGELQISFERVPKVVVEIQIRSLKGEILLTQHINKYPGQSWRHNLNLSDLPKGIYFLELIINPDIITRKVIKY